MTNSSPHPELSGSTVILRKFEADQIHERYIGWLNGKVVNRFSQSGGRRPTVAAVGKFFLNGHE